MIIKITDLIINKSCIQNTRELKNKSEKEFMEYLKLKRKENILEYSIITE